MSTAKFYYNNKHYRATVLLACFNYQGQLLVGTSLRGYNDYREQAPQGGVNVDEVNDLRSASRRELKEELGIDDSAKAGFVAAGSNLLVYKPAMPGQGFKYDEIKLGCEIVLLDPHVEIRVRNDYNVGKEEFSATRFIEPRTLIDICPSHKVDTYAQMLEMIGPVEEALRALQIDVRVPLASAIGEVANHRFVQRALADSILVPELPRFPGRLINAAPA